uniref:hypothetical protein n=1 Tax=Shewanella sp. TaxID=50422 RepID=UPI004047C05F
KNIRIQFTPIRIDAHQKKINMPKRPSLKRKTAAGPHGRQLKYKRTPLIRRPTNFTVGKPLSDGVFRPPRENFGVAGFELQPAIRKVSLRYVAEILLNAGSGANDHWIFRANGLFDPDITGTGHQPKGFDQLMTLYGKYTVVASRCKIAPYYTTAGEPSYILVHLMNGTSDATIDTIEEAMEQQNRSKIIFSGNQIDEKHSEATLGVDFKQYLGLNPEDADQLSGGESGNPTKGVYFVVNQVPVNGNDPAARTVLVQIEYDVVFTYPIEVASS